MKYILLTIVLLFLGCCSDDIKPCHTIEEINVLYDSQDNLVKINGGQWEQSWNLDTWEGLNPTIAVWHLWNTKQIQISSEEYFDILQISVNGTNYQVTSMNGDWFCTYPEMHEFMDGSDVFNIKIKAKKKCVTAI